MDAVNLTSEAIASALAHKHVLLAALNSSLMIAFIELVERRGKSPDELNPTRQIEIGTLLESMPEAVCVFDSSGQLIVANSAAKRLLRLNGQQLTAQGFANHLGTLGAEKDPGDMVVDRALRGEAVQQERRPLAVPNGAGWVETLVSANPVRDPGGRVVGALVILRDITELAVLQERIGDTERHNAIGKMAAGLAHDFSNVLDTISHAVSVMEVDPSRTPEERLVITRMIRNAVRRGSEIVAGVKRYLVGGGQEREIVDMNELLEESIELTRPLWQAVRNLSIQRHFQPVSRVTANADELRRVFTNLVINAIEAMPNGGILTVGCEQQGSRVTAFVADTGIGIPDDNKTQIFRPYFTTKQGGTGLGLAGAERAIRAQHGRMSFESKEGHGSRFSVEFPLMESRTLKTA